MRATTKILSSIAAATLAFTLTGCTDDTSSTATEEETAAWTAPETSAEAYERWMASENHANFNAKGEFNLTMQIEGLEMRMPISFDIDADGNSAHGTVSGSFAEAQGEAEFYILDEGDEMSMYAKSETSGNIFDEDMSQYTTDWVGHTASKSADYDDFAEQLTTLTKDLFEKAELSETDDGYMLSLKGKDAYEVFQEFLEEQGEAGALGNIPDEYIDGLVINYSFDKEDNLVNISVPEFSIEIPADESYDYTIVLSVNIDFTEHGEISDIEVPDDVVETAEQNAGLVEQYEDKASEIIS